MKRIRLDTTKKMTFKDGCELYLLDCRQRNLREATINHYRQSYLWFYKYFGADLPLSQIDEAKYNDYVVHLCEELDNSVSVNTYLRDLITLLHFLMDKGHVKMFRMLYSYNKSRGVETTGIHRYRHTFAKQWILNGGNISKTGQSIFVESCHEYRSKEYCADVERQLMTG